VLTRTAAVVICLILVVLPERTAESAGGEAPAVEHSYRVIGKVRLLLFWVSADEVGGARVTWRRRGDERTFSLLIGSDPGRAPRAINEWGYVLEDVRGDTATVFGLRTSTDGDSPEEADAHRAGPNSVAEFDALCSQITPAEADSWITSVEVPRDATYRHLDRVLDAIEGSRKWQRRHTSRPNDVATGFLAALDGLMGRTSDAARERRPLQPSLAASYVYKDAVYDLSIRRIERVPQLLTGSGIVRDVLRSEFQVRKRGGDTKTTFWIAYGVSGALAGIPVRAGYQPNWWFKVELELDEHWEAPPDPASQDSTRQRIDTLCTRPQ
jgi:hypothetical protein